MARTLPRWMHEKHGAYYLVRYMNFDQIPQFVEIAAEVQM